MTRRLLTAGASLILATVFVGAALPKLVDPAGFALAIHHYHLAPDGLINLMAIYLPALELCAALGLLLPRTRRAAAWLTGLMLLIFTAALASAIVRGLDVSCGCFTTNPEAGRVGILNLARNGALLLLIAWILWSPAPRHAVR